MKELVVRKLLEKAECRWFPGFDWLAIFRITMSNMGSEQNDLYSLIPTLTVSRLLRSYAFEQLRLELIRKQCI